MRLRARGTGATRGPACENHASPEEQARSRSYYTALQARPEVPLQPIIAGRWHDRLEKDGDQWWLVERVIYADLFGDLTHHIKGL